MNYRYKKGFEPQWYKKESLKNKINLLEKYFLIFILINTIFMPLTIDKLKSYSDISSVDSIESKEKDLKFIESNEIKFIKLLMKSEFYNVTSYEYKDNKGTVSFVVENINEAKKILADLKSNEINISDGVLIPLDENTWKIEFKI